MIFAWVIRPRSVLEAMEQAEPSTKPEHVDGRNWQNFPAGLKVLVVDDDPLCLKIIEQMLKRCNYEGMEVVLCCPFEPDSVCADCRS